MITLKNISKSYNNEQQPIFSNFNLTISQGECLFIQGVSGVGKSTLLNLLALLDTPDKGEIIYEGKNIFDMSESDKNQYKNQKIGVIFQKYNLLNSFSVLENILFPVVYRDFSSYKEYVLKAERILESLDLKSKMYAKISELSGGQQQRVAIARVLLQNPDIILADEPTANVDTETEKQILNIFKACIDNGKTLIIVSHNSIYETIATQKLIMER